MNDLENKILEVAFQKLIWLKKNADAPSDISYCYLFQPLILHQRMTLRCAGMCPLPLWSQVPTPLQKLQES